MRGHRGEGIARHGRATIGVAIAGGASGNARGNALRVDLTSLRQPTQERSALDSALTAVARDAQSHGTPAAMAVAASSGLTTAGNLVSVIVEASGVDQAKRSIVSAGGVVRGANLDLIDADVPPGSLESLAKSAGARYIRTPARPVSLTVSGEGVARSNAINLQDAGITGSGVKIAIIDVGFSAYRSLLGNELPATVTTPDCSTSPCAPPADPATDPACFASSNHGTAVSEIVHEEAPGAQLYLMCVENEVQLARAEQYAKANGIKVINHSVAWFNTSRGDGTGDATTPEGIAADARANGILWVNAAGNEARNHWSGTWSPAYGTQLQDFGGGSVANMVTISSGEFACAWLKWDDWPRTTQDFDLGLVRTGDQQVVAASVTDQADWVDPASSAATPTEGLCYQNTGPTATFALEIERYSATTSPRFDLYYDGASPLQYATPAGSIVEPASSPAVLAVGAVCQAFAGNVEPYSSLGPTIDGRRKPEVMGSDSVSSATYGTFDPVAGCGNSGFAGTSAAAPYVAGAAALLLQETPSLSVDALQAELERMSMDNAAVPGSGVVKVPWTLGGQIVGSIYNSGPFLKSPDGSSLPYGGTTVTNAHAPRFSPDGSKIAFSEGGVAVRVVTADGTAVRSFAGANNNPDWSPDGAKIAYDSGGSIVIVNADGSGSPTALTPASSGDAAPSWSPDGTRIAFVRGPFSAADIYVQNADGSGTPTRLTTLGNVDTSSNHPNPDWSPDGSKIVFATNSQIWLVNAIGTSAHAITPVNSNMRYTAPTWSPDGTSILFSDVFGNGTGGGIYTMHADGTGERLLFLTPYTGYSVDGVSWTSVSPPAVPAANVAQPVVSGDPRVGQTLQVQPGTWSGRPRPTEAIDWRRCTGSTFGSCATSVGSGLGYTVTNADAGFRIHAFETASNTGATISNVADTLAVDTSVQTALPTLTAIPTISGAAQPGSVLTASTGTWTGSPTKTLQWRWCQVDGSMCVDIPGATASTFTLSSAYVGLTIRASVRAANAAGAREEASAATAIVAAPAPAPGPVTPPTPGGGGGGGGGGSGHLASG